MKQFDDLKHFNQLVARIAMAMRLSEDNCEQATRLLHEQYAITLRNTSESADNTKPEHSIDQEQMMSQIEDIALDMANSVPNQNSKYNRKDSYEFEHFQQELKDCFAMHFKADSKTSNNSDEQSITDDELVSKIKDRAYEINRCESIGGVR